MKPNNGSILLVISLGLLLGLGLLLAGTGVAAPPTLPPASATAAEWRVCPAGPPACDYATVQEAVDAAAAGDVVKVAAGLYTDIHARPSPAGYNGPAVITQVVYISQSLTMRGGYSADFAAWDPDLYPTTLDAQGQGREFLVSGPGITVTIEGLILTGGSADGLGGSPAPYLGRDAGGGIYVAETTFAISGCTVYSNTATASSDFGYGGGMHLESGSATLIGNVFQDNVAATAGAGHGGGLNVLGEPTSVYTLISNRFLSNTAGLGVSGYGGGIYLYGAHAPCTIVLDGNTFQGNVASRAAGSGSGGRGGGLALDCAKVIMKSNTIVDNVAGADAAWGRGGGYIDFGSCSLRAITLTGNTFRGNVAGEQGGSGGAISFETGGIPMLYPYTLSGNLFQGNIASPGTAEGRGGGLYAEDAGILIGNTFQGNRASTLGNGVGGGLHLWGSVTLEDNVVQGNEASQGGTGFGGGIYFYGYMGNQVHLATFRGNTIVSNTVPGPSDLAHGGGGLYLVGGVTTLEGNVLRGNSAPEGGGAFLIQGSPYAGQTTWSNNVVMDNQVAAGGHGSCLFLDSYSTLDPLHAGLAHNTLARNSGGDGSGVYVHNSTAVFTNTIVYSHSVGLNNAGGTVSMDHTLWDDNGTQFTGTVNETNPLFGDTAFAPDGYHLTAASAAVDQGIDAGVRYDIDGQHRPAGPAPDVGADEFAFSVYLPLVLRGSLSP